MPINKINNLLVKFSFKKKILVKTHKNFCKLFYFKNDKFFRKLSINKLGIERLSAERKGIIWYCKKIGKNNNKIIKEFLLKKNYAHLETYKIDGLQVKSWNSLEKNYKYLIKVYKHYIKFFPKTKISKIHGDFTLDNIIFNKKNIFIIDWEFFYSRKNYRCYDLAYLFLSSLCLPYIAKNRISLKDEKLFLNLWRLLLKLKVNKKIISNPFTFFEKNIREDKFLKKNYALSKSKFFPFITKKDYKKRVLSLIKKEFLK